MRCYVLAAAWFALGCNGFVSDRPLRPGDRDPDEPDRDPRSMMPTLPGDEGDPNAVDHESLFVCDGEAQASPSRVWRMSNPQFVDAFDGGSGTRTRLADRRPFTPSPQTRFENYASSGGMDEPVFDVLLAVAHDMADHNNSGRIEACLTDASPPAIECYRALASARAPRYLQRPATPDEIEHYARTFLTIAQADGKSDALLVARMYEVLAPTWLFRSERGEGEPDAHGRRSLGPWEIRRALAYALRDERVEGAIATGLDADARDGSLVDPARIEHWARELGSDLSNNDVVHRFLREWLIYDRVEFKDPTRNDQARHELMRFPEGFAQAYAEPMWRDRSGAGATREWLVSILASRERFLEQLLLGPIGNASDGRAGLLTDPGWLVSFSEAFGPDPIRRGKFITESLLCQAMPDIPLDVVPQIPEVPGATLRERLAEHRADPNCARCHQMLDGIGIGLAAFDDYGRARRGEVVWLSEREAMLRELDTTATLIGSGDVDGPFDGAVELSNRLARSTRVRQCFVRHAFRFWMGRNERPADSCSLVAMDRAYVESNGDLLETLVALFRSDAFRYRRDAASTEGE